MSPATPYSAGRLWASSPHTTGEACQPSGDRFTVLSKTDQTYLTPHTAVGKIFTTFYVLIGVGIITTFISFTMRRRGDKAMRKCKSKHLDE